MKSETIVIIDESIYPREAIYGAAYIFVDRAYIYLDIPEKGKISIRFRSKNENESLNKIEGEYMNELLQYVLRLSIASDNKKIREQIVEQALFAALGREERILNNQTEKFEFEDDPLGIAIPWEDKYGKK